MRILFVGPFPWPSHQGSQTYLAGQVRALVDRGHDVTLAVYGAGTGGTIPGATLIRGRAIPGGDFSAGGLHWSRPLADLALARRIRRWCRTHPVDVIHAHNVEGPLIAHLAATGRPVVYDLHTEMADELAAHLPRPLRALGPPIGRRLDRLAVRWSDAGCAISDAAHAALRGRGLPTVMVGPGVDPAELVARPGVRRRFALPDRFVVYTGNLDAYQDLPLLYQAMATVDVPLVIVTGSQAPVPDGVVVIRSTAFADALDVLSEATLGVIPRRRCTGFPIKLLNQLGMGCPTVMVDPRHPRIPGVVGSSPARLPRTLRELLAAPATLRRLGDTAQQAIRTDWTWASRAARLEAVHALAVTGSSA